MVIHLNKYRNTYEYVSINMKDSKEVLTSTKSSSTWAVL